MNSIKLKYGFFSGAGIIYLLGEVRVRVIVRVIRLEFGLEYPSTCSVRSTEALLYLLLVSEPSVARRRRKRSRAKAHTISSQFRTESRNVL